VTSHAHAARSQNLERVKIGDLLDITSLKLAIAVREVKPAK
jgi:hypothetical protein